MRVVLPKGIDYTLYKGQSGMSTKDWGPDAWSFLFTSIMGRYPLKVSKHNKDHVSVRKHFKHLLVSLKDILPCVFCRNSFKSFLKELPIEPFLSGRLELMYWLYLMKDKVNNKLIAQEQECLNDEKERLKNLYYTRRISKQEYHDKLSTFKKMTFCTQPSPPFKEILDKYEQYRAVCSKKAKTCSRPTSNIILSKKT
jgi:hypothetical protein